MGKFYSSKTLLKMAGGGRHPPTSHLDPPLIVTAINRENELDSAVRGPSLLLHNIYHVFKLVAVS